MRDVTTLIQKTSSQKNVWFKGITPKRKEKRLRKKKKERRKIKIAISKTC